MKLKIGLDVDGTLYESWGRANEYIKERTGAPVQPWTSYDYLRDEYGAELADGAFRHACGPETMDSRQVYPQVVEAIQQLHIWSIDFVVVTHSYDPDAQWRPLNRWLKDNVFGKAPFKLCVLHHHESKIELMKACKLFGLIDDKPSIITEVGRAGLFAAAKKHDYTTELLWEPGVRVFEEWGTVPSLIQRYLYANV